MGLCLRTREGTQLSGDSQPELRACGHVALLQTSQAQVWSSQWTLGTGLGGWHQPYPLRGVQFTQEPKLKRVPAGTHLHLLRPGRLPAAGPVLGARE